MTTLLNAPCHNATPHPRAAIIKAWADGAAIEYRTATSPNAPWLPYPSDTPCWHSNVFEFRVKPTPPKVRSRRCFWNGGTQVFVTLVHDTPGYTTPEDLQTSTRFIAWIDKDWQEHDVPQ